MMGGLEGRHELVVDSLGSELIHYQRCPQGREAGKGRINQVRKTEKGQALKGACPVSCSAAAQATFRQLPGVRAYNCKEHPKAEWLLRNEKADAHLSTSHLL